MGESPVSFQNKRPGQSRAGPYGYGLREGQATQETKRPPQGPPPGLWGGGG